MKSHYVSVEGTPLGPVWFGAVVSIFFLVDGVDASFSSVAQKHRLEFWGSSTVADINGLLIMLFKRIGDWIIENKNMIKCHVTFRFIGKIRCYSNAIEIIGFLSGLNIDALTHLTAMQVEYEWWISIDSIIVRRILFQANKAGT